MKNQFNTNPKIDQQKFNCIALLSDFVYHTVGGGVVLQMNKLVWVFYKFINTRKSLEFYLEFDQHSACTNDNNDKWPVCDAPKFSLVQQIKTSTQRDN